MRPIPTKQKAKEMEAAINAAVNTKTYCRIANQKSSIRECYQLFPVKKNGVRPELADGEKKIIVNYLISLNAINCSRDNLQLLDFWKYWNGSSLTFIIPVKAMPGQRKMYVVK